MSLITFDLQTAVSVSEGAKRLSPRETEVLRQLMLGQTASEAADALGISRRTVEVHAGNIRRRFGSLPLLIVATHLAVLEERDRVAAAFPRLP